jgi:hypothetical protein
MDDPVRTRLFQPIVDRFGLRPRDAARSAADVFMAAAITLTCVRAATLDWTVPGLSVTLAMAITGAFILWGMMRFCASAGPAFVTGPIAAVHLLIRGVLLYSVAADVVQIWMLVGYEGRISSMSLMRALMQLAQNIAGTASLYLALCKDPPPRRPRRIMASAGA